jgi:peptidyl-prolyl cis-trans isomerase C
MLLNKLLHTDQPFHYKITIALVMALTMAFSSAFAQTEATNTTARILAKSQSGAVVTQHDVESELQRASETARKNTLAKPEALQALVSNLLVRRELAAEARSSKLADSPVVQASVAIAQDGVLSEARLGALDKQNTPSDAALDAFAKSNYAAHGEKYERPTQSRASHILIPSSAPDALAKAKDVLAQLRKGASFEAMAKEHSSDRGSADKGGDLGYFGPGKMVKPFETAVDQLAQPGDLSEPVETQFGFHIIRLEGRKPKGRIPYEELREKLMAEARQNLVNEGRIKKVDQMKLGFTIHASEIEAFSKAATPAPAGPSAKP